MTAVACLRVEVEGERTGLSPEVLGPLVAKFSGAYLETRWLWPRQFQPLSHYAFLLTDPRADELDVRELAKLSDELQTKLFGAREEDGGEVALLVFEGPAEAATAFAALDAKGLADAMRNPESLPQGGRLTRIVSPGAAEREPEVIHASPEWVAISDAADAAPAALERPMPALEGLQGIYFTPRELFVGDVVSSTPGRLNHHLSLVEGPEHMPQDTEAFDASCVIAAVRFLTEGVHAMLYLPICYSNIVKPSKRQEYETLLSILPPERRPLLAATVYDVPRDPAFSALSGLRALLSRHVTNIDLRTGDPGFEIEKLSEGAVTSVTLVIPGVEPKARHAAIRRFAGRMELYKRRKIWPGVTDVRNRAELDLCTALKVPFVTGPGVCRMQSAPVGGRLQPLARLPVLAA